MFNVFHSKNEPLSAVQIACDMQYDEVIEDNKAKAQQAESAKNDGNGGDDEKQDDNAPSSRDDKATDKPSEYKDIGAHFACKSSLLTFSFQVKSEQVIKLYLYHNGQCMRFMPEDIRDILPMLFNVKYGNNAQWLTIKANDVLMVDSYIEQLQRCLKDVEFEAFRQTYM